VKGYTAAAAAAVAVVAVNVVSSSSLAASSLFLGIPHVGSCVGQRDRQTTTTTTTTTTHTHTHKVITIDSQMQMHVEEKQDIHSAKIHKNAMSDHGIVKRPKVYQSKNANSDGRVSYLLDVICVVVVFAEVHHFQVEMNGFCMVMWDKNLHSCFECSIFL
jgi:hypothetical protein